MNKVIVTTTINPPTEAIQKFDAMKDWALVVVGDQKTPPDYHLDRGLYLSPICQEAYAEELSDAIGWNCIQRRNVGFLWAMKEMKADIVATVDDDNIPYDDWGKDLMIEPMGLDAEITHSADEVFDPFMATNHKEFWHRGFPIKLVSQRKPQFGNGELFRADIQADFWDGDPDVDAICRMIHNPVDCRFDPSCFPFAADRVSPFNSQNTFLSAKVMPHYFMYPGVGRMDDIFSSYHVQQQGFKVVYGKPSVRQVRNPHDLTKDMKAEYLGYEHCLDIVRGGSVEPFLPEQAKRAFRLYQKHYE